MRFPRAWCVLVLTVFLACAAAAAEAGTPEIPNPLATVRPGQWVRYRHSTMYGVAEQKQTVLAVSGDGDERVISIESVMAIEGETVDERTDTITYGAIMEEQRSALADAADLTVTPMIIPFNGRDLPGVRVEFANVDGRFRLVLSDLVPLSGVIRMEEEGEDEPVMELLDFGEQ
ncbi:MAG: hypothetical protein LUE17_13520 [Planctomycetaceae bacterium]|nr:hypothetical protein [Planctomycetaceae bacterium]